MAGKLGGNGLFPTRSLDEGMDGERGPGLLPLAICLLFVAPLAFGLWSLSSSLSLTNRASRFTRDIAGMFHQGVDFSRPENQAIVFEHARAHGVPLAPDNSVIHLSAIHMVSDSDCARAAADVCVNRGFPVLERRIVIGKARLHASSLRAGESANAESWLTDPSTRVKDFEYPLHPGETAWAAEAWFTTMDQPTGIYVRSFN